MVAAAVAFNAANIGAAKAFNAANIRAAKAFNAANLGGATMALWRFGVQSSHIAGKEIWRLSAVLGRPMHVELCVPSSALASKSLQQEGKSSALVAAVVASMRRR